MKSNREEIIKALECCKDRACVEGCTRLCNNIPMEDDCRLNLIHDALALIKELTEENSNLDDTIACLKIELETVKADTVQKMQERLKQYENMHVASPCNFCRHSLRGNRNTRCNEDLQCFGFNKWESVIDQVAEEMLEENNV